MRAAPGRAQFAPRFVARAKSCADMPKTLECRPLECGATVNLGSPQPVCMGLLAEGPPHRQGLRLRAQRAPYRIENWAPHWHDGPPEQKSRATRTRRGSINSGDQN